VRVTDTKLRRIAHQFRKGLLGSRASRLNCFIVCAPLQGYLSACGIGTDIVEGFPSGGDVSNHVWLRLSDGRVLDPTADQFGPQYPPIYIGEPLEFHKLTPTCAACHKRLPEDCIFDSATGERVHYECQEGKDGG
jgi:hypothetical protein